MTGNPIRVNGVDILLSDITAEAQNHPADSPEKALADAKRALVVRELLLQRGKSIGIDSSPEGLGSGRQETEEESIVRRILEIEVTVPEADEESCKRYYDNNKRRFVSQTLYEASHILFAANPKDEPAYRTAAEKAKMAIERLEKRPGSFAGMARDLSDCPSSNSGGNLGQVTRGSTVPEVETFLDALDDGQLCPVPVKSRYGAHVLRLDRRIEGQQLPFEAVLGKIRDYLEESSWRRAVAQYVQILVGQAEIEGVELDGVNTPLVR